jgi:hypothetical protein
MEARGGGFAKPLERCPKTVAAAERRPKVG